jgi:hypothetical protein
MGKWANGQMGKWANGQMGKRANGQTGKRANGQTGKEAQPHLTSRPNGAPLYDSGEAGGSRERPSKLLPGRHTRDDVEARSSAGPTRPHRRTDPRRRMAGTRLSASPSVAAGHAEDVLADEVEHHVVVNRGGHVKACLAELALHVVLAREAVAAVCVQTGVGRVPGGL